MSKNSNKAISFQAALERLEEDYYRHQGAIEREKTNIFISEFDSFISDLKSSMRVGKWNKSFFNIFEVLGLTKWEESYSNTMAWLLNPYEAHGLGNAFLNLFLEEINMRKTSASDIVFVYRELAGPSSIPDVVIDGKSANRDFSIIIENKIFSSEGDMQTFRQKSDFDQRSDEVKFVFLSPAGYKPACEDFMPISYRQILAILEKCNPKEEAAVFLEHFKQAIKLII